MNAFTHIENHELVVEVFGYWPSFHDAEILWLKMERVEGTYQDYISPNIEFVIHVWEMTKETTENGFLKLQKHHLIHFKFEDIYDVELGGFNNQNALFELKINEKSKNESGIIPLQIILDPAYGLGGEFKSYKGSILGITPCNEHGKSQL